MKFYAVRVGRVPGIYLDWPSCQKQVNGFSGAQYKSFSNKEMAEQYIDGDDCKRTKSVESVEKGIGIETVTSNRTIVYTDGSSIDYVGGYGWLWLDGATPVTDKGKVPGSCTNQKAELYAIWKAVNGCPSDKIDLYTDSKYSIGCLTDWWKSWIRNGWKTSKGEPVVNRELIMATLSVLKVKDVKFYHVKGHSGNKWNELCDQLANEGRMM